jgi:L-threonylcarbamoyladenylate synthase
MKTLFLKINPKNPEKDKINLAAEVLRQGGLVAFPTDTVYGLGADATNAVAVKKIYKVKKRTLSKALPILIDDKKDLVKYASGISDGVKRLAKKFWPGPLTIVIKKKKIIPNIVTAGKKTVGIRVPDHPVALALIRALGRPLATTSANISDKRSPTTARGVKKYLNKKIDLILDGGKTKLGAESSVLDCTTSPPTVLRSGAIPIQKIEKIIGKTKTGR